MPRNISICRYMLIFVDVNALIQIGRYQAIFYQCHIKKYQVGYKDVCNVWFSYYNICLIENNNRLCWKNDHLFYDPVVDLLVKNGYTILEDFFLTKLIHFRTFQNDVIIKYMYKQIVLILTFYKMSPHYITVHLQMRCLIWSLVPIRKIDPAVLWSMVIFVTWVGFLEACHKSKVILHVYVFSKRVKFMRNEEAFE